MIKDIKFQDMMNKRKRLCQNHSLVEYLERKHGIVLKIEMMLEVRVQKQIDLLWARQSGLNAFFSRVGDGIGRLGSPSHLNNNNNLACHACLIFPL